MSASAAAAAATVQEREHERGHERKLDVREQEHAQEQMLDEAQAQLTPASPDSHTKELQAWISDYRAQQERFVQEGLRKM